MDSLKQKTAVSFIWKFLERSGASLVQLLVQIVMARVLAPDDFGMLAVILVFVSIGNVVVQSGLSTALVQAPDVDDDDFSTVFWISLVISLLLFLCVFVAAPYIGEFYHSSELTWPLRILMMVLVINALNSVQVSYVQRELEFKKIFYATIISVIISGSFGIGSALAGFGLWALVIQQLSYQGINCYVLFKQISWHPALVFDPKKAKSHFLYGWKLLASGLLNTAYNSLSDLIIGKQFSTFDLGLVSQGKKYPQTIGTILNGTMQSVVLSAVAKVQNDKGRVKHLARLTLKTSIYLIVPTMLLFAVLAEPIVRFVFGEQWLPCVPFLQMYCIVYCMLPVHTTNLQVLNAVGRSDMFLKLEFIKVGYGIVLVLIAAFVLKDVYLMVGSYILGGVIGTFVNAWPNRSIIGYTYSEQLHDILPAIVAATLSACLAGAVSLTPFPDALVVIMQVAVMIAAYLLLSKLLKIDSLSYVLDTVKELAASKTKSK